MYQITINLTVELFWFDMQLFITRWEGQIEKENVLGAQAGWIWWAEGGPG